MRPLNPTAMTISAEREEQHVHDKMNLLSNSFQILDFLRWNGDKNGILIQNTHFDCYLFFVFFLIKIFKKYKSW